MENENAIKSFDDLVFENRNKMYGAYAIRKSYNDNVSKAVFIALLSSSIVVVLSSFASNETEVPEVDPRITCQTKWDNKVIIEPIKTIHPPKATRVKNVTTNYPPAVTTEPVVDTPVEPPTTATSNDGSEGNAEVIGSDLGVITDTPPAVMEPPVKAEPKIYYHAEFMPRFVGGEKAMIKFIQKTFHYPAVARRMTIEGTVYVSFVVDAEGNVTMVKIEKGVSKECDEEAIRIIEKMPQWIAGRQGNIPVSVRQCLPIKFKLNND